MTEAAPPKSTYRGAAIAASVAGLAAMGALACAACCIVPFALPAAALALAGGALARLASIYEWAIVAAVVLVAIAWVCVAFQSVTASKRPAVATMLVIFGATAMLALVYSWPLIEPIVVAKPVAR